jgi:hypothetical protein
MQVCIVIGILLADKKYWLCGEFFIFISPISGGPSVSIVRSRTKAMELVSYDLVIPMVFWGSLYILLYVIVITN